MHEWMEAKGLHKSDLNEMEDVNKEFWYWWNNEYISKFKNADLELNINIHLADAKNLNLVDQYLKVNTDKDNDSVYWLDIYDDSYCYGSEEDMKHDMNLLLHYANEDQVSISIDGVPSEY